MMVADADGEDEKEVSSGMSSFCFSWMDFDGEEGRGVDEEAVELREIFLGFSMGSKREVLVDLPPGSISGAGFRVEL